MKRLAAALIPLAFLLCLGALLAQRRDLTTATAEVTRLTGVADSLRRDIARADMAGVVLVDTLVRRLVRTDTLTRTVQEWKHDTVRVVEYVERADSALKACAAVIVSCDERVRLRDQRLAVVSDSLPRAVATVWQGKLDAERARTVKVAAVSGLLGALACALWCQ